MTPEIEKHFTANQSLRKKDIVLGNFLGGLAWGIGSVIGATLIVGILLGLFKGVINIPKTSISSPIIEANP